VNPLSWRGTTTGLVVLPTLLQDNTGDPVARKDAQVIADTHESRHGRVASLQCPACYAGLSNGSCLP